VSRLSKPRIAITAVGCVTPLGNSLEDTFAALLRGESAVGPIGNFDASGLPVTFAAELIERPKMDQGRLKLDLTQRCWMQIQEQIGGSELPDRIGVCVGSEAARPDLVDFAARLRSGEGPNLDELQRNAADAPANWLAEACGAKGPISTVSTACTSSSQAVGEGFLRLVRGEVDAMIVGGVDVLVGPLMVTGFSLLGALSTRNDDPKAASRPFDKDRDGFVLGEGAGFLLLETEASAKAAGRTPLAALSGYGTSCNAWRLTDSPPDGRGAAQAMFQALETANITPQEVGYINAHGTSTGMNDPSEAAGINRVFGPSNSAPVVSSSKSMMGHLVAACGAVEALVCLEVVRQGKIPPTLNLDSPDPRCDLNHVVGGPKKADVKHALSNAFGFGGSNGALVISSWD
jgi:3-oxoacyl-[acyl-carrier-protein] synthase II